MPKRRTVTALRLDEIDDVIALNYLSPVRLIHVLLPRMIDRARPAAIVNMSSVAARLAPAGEASYAASKAALTAFSESLAVEIWDSNVQVHVVNPGVIDTPLFELPDNDPMYAVVEARPAALVADAILDQLRVGTFEIYVPDEFGQFALGKAANLQPYLEGSAAYYRSMTQQD